MIFGLSLPFDQSVIPVQEAELKTASDKPIQASVSAASRKDFKKATKGRHCKLMGEMCNAADKSGTSLPPSFLSRLLSVFGRSHGSFPGRLSCLSLTMEILITADVWTDCNSPGTISLLKALGDGLVEIREHESKGLQKMNAHEEAFIIALEGIAYVRTSLTMPSSQYWQKMTRARRHSARLLRGEAESVGVFMLPKRGVRQSTGWALVKPPALFQNYVQRISLREQSVLDEKYGNVDCFTGGEPNRIMKNIEAVRWDRCQACGRRAHRKCLFRCAKCGVARYCDMACHTWHWHHQHRAECQRPGVFKVGNYVRFPDTSEDAIVGTISSLSAGELVKEVGDGTWVVIWVGIVNSELAKPERKVMSLHGAVRDAYCVAIERAGGLFD